MLTEQSLRSHSLRVQNVHQRDSILRQTSREDDYLEVLAHLNNELLAVWAHLDVYVARSTLDVDWKNNVSLIRWLERRVHKCLIHV